MLCTWVIFGSLVNLCVYVSTSARFSRILFRHASHGIIYDQIYCDICVYVQYLFKLSGLLWSQLIPYKIMTASRNEWFFRRSFVIWRNNYISFMYTYAYDDERCDRLSFSYSLILTLSFDDHFCGKRHNYVEYILYACRIHSHSLPHYYKLILVQKIERSFINTA